MGVRRHAYNPAMTDATHDPAAASRRARLDALLWAAESGARDPAVRAVVGVVLSTLRSDLGREPSPRETAQRLLDSLGEIVAYDPDPTGGEAVRLPTLVLGSRKGDAEELAVVFVAMCRCANVEAALAWLDQPQHAVNHVFARVKVGDRWLDAETTLRGARVGEAPYEAMRRLQGGAAGGRRG